MARTLSKNPKQDMSRLRRFAANHLGTIMGDEMSGGKIFRRAELDVLDQYYDNTQYDDKIDWEQALKSENYIPVRDRKPRVIYGLPKALVNKVAAKLVGSAVFPQFVVEDEEDDTAFFRTVLKASKFRRSMIEPVKNLLKSGAVFVRFYLVNGAIKIEYAQSKYCYPVFDAVGELESIEIKYVYEDWKDIEKGKPRKKWYRLQLSKTVDTMFDNPIYRPGSTPEFKEVASAEHGLGWVQGEWMVTHEDKFDYDGYSLYGDILDFCDELNYSLSQTSQGISYNQEPQLTVNNLDEDEVDGLIRSSQKAWNLGREGKAEHLQTDMKGLEQAETSRDHMRNLALDVVRIVLHDPEKMAGSAQSGAALNILNAPLVELVDELRQVIEPRIVNLLIKIGLTALHYNAIGEETVIEAPPGYMPASLDVTVSWPPIYPPTIDDIAKAATAANTLNMGQIISKESLTRWIGQMIPSVDNIEEELEKIAAEPPPPSPFGGGFGG